MRNSGTGNDRHPGDRHIDAQPIELHPIDTAERDACALICSVRKTGEATHGNVKRTIEGLARMGHRSGYVDGEGDGVGILTDIPRQLWSKRLSRAGLRSSMATHPDFWVAHVMIPARERPRASNLIDEICRQITDSGLHVLIDQPGKVNSLVLGPNAEKNEPVFWQIAGMNGQVPSERLERTLFDLQVMLEKSLGVHFPSFSSYSVVYKVQGTVEILRRYYPELRDPDYASTVTMGHARYSTNTNPIFERAQPFGFIGHNGEFNTISRFRLEAAMLGIPLDPNNSDSQDVDRVMQALCHHFDLDLAEAMETIFPPHDHDLIQHSPELHTMYREMRQAFGPFAQGPAAVAARHGNLCVFSVDALGLRPLWFGETEKEFFATSERGVYPLDAMAASPRPLAPGEKVALRIRPGHSIDVLDYPEIQRHVFNRYRDRVPANGDHGGNGWRLQASGLDLPLAAPDQPHNPGGNGGHQRVLEPAPVAAAQATRVEPAPATNIPVMAAGGQPLPWTATETRINTNTMAALGWERYHTEIIDTMSLNGREQIGSLGWDGPLAALSHKRVNIADFFKETVAVVTNPAIDRERENAQFSTRMTLGVRPAVGQRPHPDDLLVEIDTPLLTGGHPDLGTLDDMRAAADRHGTLTLEDLLSIFGDRARTLSMSAALHESAEAADRKSVV